MTNDREPPRLRTLGGELPEELLLALRDSEGDAATPAELALVARRVRAAAAMHDDEVPRLPYVPRRSAVRGRAASLVLMFSVGALAGGVVSGGVFVMQRVRWLEVTKSAPVFVSPPQKPALRLATPLPAASAAPEPMSDAPLSLPPRPPPEPARFPTQNSESEPPSTPSASPTANRAELALLARAQGALGSNPGVALALTSDHERKFPHGALVQEREVLAIDALLRLGRRGEAAARAARFHREFPASVHGRRLDVLLGTGGGAERDHN